MKKILKNKKGFTLIELLAVIVVLAIIMVIATQQINGTIKKNRADSFVSSYKTILSSLELCEAQNMSADVCKSTIKISDEDYDFELVSASFSDEDNGYKITLKAKNSGQFKNMDLTKYYSTTNLKGTTTVEAMKIEAEYKFTS